MEMLLIALVVVYASIWGIAEFERDQTGRYPEWYRKVPSPLKRAYVVSIVGLAIVMMGKFPPTAYKAPEVGQWNGLIKLGVVVICIAVWEAIRPLFFAQAKVKPTVVAINGAVDGEPIKVVVG